MKEQRFDRTYGVIYQVTVAGWRYVVERATVDTYNVARYRINDGLRESLETFWRQDQAEQFCLVSAHKKKVFSELEKRLARLARREETEWTWREIAELIVVLVAGLTAETEQEMKALEEIGEERLISTIQRKPPMREGTTERVEVRHA